MCQLANMYGSGIGVDQSHDLMYQYYKAAANKDDSSGQCGMGDCYMYGYGVKQNESVGFEWYKKSADQNNTSALYRLAYCYCEGRGVAKDKTFFLLTLEKAANLDYTPAKVALGYEYYNGENLNAGSNLTKAVKWFKEAAEDGDAFSQAVLGYSYYTGTELFSVKDYAQAFPYLYSAVRNPDFEYEEDSVKADIYRCLAGSYRYGRGCQADQSLASYYTEQAAKYGDAGSIRATGIIRKDVSGH
jgi:TPR repeat protein